MKTIKKFTLTVLILMISIIGLQFEPLAVCADSITDPATGIIFDSATGSITGFSGDTAYLTIPASIGGVNVTNIAADAFYNCRTLKSVSIPSGVTEIGKEAFSFCTFLTSVTIPNTVTMIDSSAFEYCSALISINIPDSVTSLGYDAFNYCTSLASVTIPSCIISFSYSFGNCTSLKSVTIQSGVTQIYSDEFNNCTSLASIAIPDTVKTIGSGAFSGCTALNSLILPNNLTTISDNTFTDCTSLASITIPGNVSSIGNNAFADTGLTSLTIPSSITSTGENVFTDCTSLKSVTIQNGLSSIGDSMFYDCSVLTVVAIPCSVTTIENAAFENCTTLSSIVIPSNVSTVNQNAFSNCTDLTSVTVQGSSTNLDSDVFQGSNNVTIYAPLGSNAQSYASNIGLNFVKAATDITLKSPPTKSTYLQGQNLNLTGAIITAHYNDGSSSDINITSSMISGYDSSKTGTQTITVTYSGVSTSFTVNVIQIMITGITIRSYPAQITYFQGQNLDLTDAVITAIYNDGSSSDIDVTSSMISGYDNTKTGTQTVTVTYCGVSTSFTVNVNQRTITGITMKSYPTQTTYFQGQNLDLDGAVVTATYNDNTSADINVTSSMISGYDSSKTGTQTVTVTYCGVSTSFTINVTQKTVTKIIMKSNPAQTSYLQGQNLNLSGAVITVSFIDGTSSDINVISSMISGYDSGKTGAQTVTVTYCGVSTSFTVNVSVPITVSGVKNNSFYNCNVTITFNEGTSTLNGKPFKSGSVVSAENTYTLTITDTAGNVTKIVFAIDKTPPVIKASIKNGSYTSSNVNVTCTDSNFASISALRNNSSFKWPSNNTFTTDGIYVITAADKAGNKTTYKFAIDKLAPAVSATKTNHTTVKNNGFSNTNVTVTVSDSALSSKTIKLNNKNITWVSNNTFSAEGKYVVTAKDKFNRITTYTFTIDKTPPVITVKNSSGKVITNGSSSKSFATFTYSESNFSYKTLSLNGKNTTWPSSGKVTAKGTYVITIGDKAGNNKTFTFKIV